MAARIFIEPKKAYVFIDKKRRRLAEYASRRVADAFREANKRETPIDTGRLIRSFHVMGAGKETFHIEWRTPYAGFVKKKGQPRSKRGYYIDKVITLAIKLVRQHLPIGRKNSPGNKRLRAGIAAAQKRKEAMEQRRERRSVRRILRRNRAV